VEVRSATGCLKRDSIDITIYPRITNSLKSNYQICANEPRILEADSQHASTYQWFSKSGLMGNTSAISVSKPGTYWVITTDKINCSATDSVKVVTDPDPITARFLAATFVNVGDTVKFVQLSYPDPVVFTWDFADGITSTNSDPIHRYLRNGDFNSSLFVKDPNECHDQLSKTITVRLLRQQGDIQIDLPFFEANYSLYPNPTTDRINLLLDFNQKATTQLILFDLEGKILATKEITIESEIIEFDIKSLAPGTYVIKILVNGDVKQIRFIKL
jgi:PKD repeat protein